MKTQIYLIALVVVIGLVAVMGMSGFFQSSPSTSSSGGAIQYHGIVCVSKNGELLECNDNVLYNTGRELIEEMLMNGASGAVVNISLCNASAACGFPIVAGTESYTEYNGCGLIQIAGSSDTLGTGSGNWSVYNTFTSSCDGRKTNVTRLHNATGGNFAGNNFSLVTLDNGDKLTINWTVYVG